MIICINDKFTDKQKELIPNRPVLDKTYSIRDIFYLPTGLVGVHLNEISNPDLPHPSGLGYFEPSFNSERFTNLDTTPLNYNNEKATIKFTINDFVGIN